MRLAIRFFIIMALGAAITIVTSSNAMACGDHEEVASEVEDEAESNENTELAEHGAELEDCTDCSSGECPEKESEGCLNCTHCACCPLLSTSLLAVETSLPPPQLTPDPDGQLVDYGASASPGFLPGIFKPPRA